MIINSHQQLTAYREAARIATEILAQLRDRVAPGVFPNELDELAGKLCQEYGVRAAFKGVKQAGLTYQHHSCIAVNDEILHGIPDRSRALAVGDLVKLDFGIVYQGLFTDQCVTVGVKEVSAEDMKLLQIGKESVLLGIKAAIPGNRTGDIGYVMHRTAYRAGFDVLKQYVGHGIGHSLHEEPEIPAFGRPKTGQILREGMVICVEDQVVPGDDRVYVTDNGWTVKTVDGSKGVMFEYMVVVGKKPEILTPTLDWPLVV